MPASAPASAGGVLRRSSPIPIPKALSDDDVYLIGEERPQHAPADAALRPA